MKNQFRKICIVSVVILFVAVSFYASQAEARSGCCSHHSGVCGCRCCDGSSLSAKCAPYYPSCSPVPSIPLSEPKPVTPIIIPKTNYATSPLAYATVIRVVDGDTIQIKFSDNTIEKVRLIGIDTPETVDPRKPVECFGKEASVKMKELVDGKTVKLVRKSDENRGKYDRLLRYVYVDDLFINTEMIKQGYAYAYTKYPFDTVLMEKFKEYEKDARENKKGLWADGACETPDKQTGILNQDTEIIKNNNSNGLLGILIFLILGGIGYWTYKKVSFNKLNIKL